MNRFENAVNVITEAFRNKKLIPGNSCFCFCGTLTGGKDWWVTICDFRSPHPILSSWLSLPGEKQIQATGYSVSEIDRIERVFESAVYDLLGDLGYNHTHSKNELMLARLAESNSEFATLDHHTASSYFIEQNNVDLYPAVRFTFEELVKIEEEAGNKVSFEFEPNSYAGLN